MRICCSRRSRVGWGKFLPAAKAVSLSSVAWDASTGSCNTRPSRWVDRECNFLVHAAGVAAAAAAAATATAAALITEKIMLWCEL
eukprot:480854-Pelagomonas_calceolata.AAC.2